MVYMTNQSNLINLAAAYEVIDASTAREWLAPYIPAFAKKGWAFISAGGNTSGEVTGIFARNGVTIFLHRINGRYHVTVALAEHHRDHYYDRSSRETVGEDRFKPEFVAECVAMSKAIAKAKGKHRQSLKAGAASKLGLR